MPASTKYATWLKVATALAKKYGMAEDEAMAACLKHRQIVECGVRVRSFTNYVAADVHKAVAADRADRSKG